MRTAPRTGAPIIVAVTRDTLQLDTWMAPVLLVEWLAEEGVWWTGGCHRYSADDFLGWLPVPAELGDLGPDGWLMSARYAA